MEIKIKGKIWKTGGGHVLTIPKTHIESGTLKEGQEITVVITNE